MIGLLIVTHHQVGQVLFDTAVSIYGQPPFFYAIIHVEHDIDVQQAEAEMSEQIKKLDQGDGVLILTDIYGATPANIAFRQIQTNHAYLISGMNLPMLLKVFNYADLDLGELVEKAVAGAIQGIMIKSQPSLGDR